MVNGIWGAVQINWKGDIGDSLVLPPVVDKIFFWEKRNRTTSDDDQRYEEEDITEKTASDYRAQLIC